EETEIELRIVGGEPRRNRRCRWLHDRQRAGWHRFKQHTTTRRRTVCVARHERANPLERVCGDAAAIAQPAGQLAVIDGASAESRFGEPAHAAKLADLLEDLFVHGGVS